MMDKSIAQEEFELCKKVADKGDVASQFNLALMYFNGEGVEHNKDKALELVDELIKQVNGRISMKKIQVSPDSRWRPNNFNSRDEQIQHYNNQLNGYMSKFTELVNLKRMMMDIKQ